MNGLPVIVATRHDAARSEVEIVVPADCRWFEGHFSAYPILPGVVHIGWAIHFAAELRGFNANIRTLEQVKFKRPILPDARLILHLAPSADGRKLRYDYRDADTSYSSGTLVDAASV